MRNFKQPLLEEYVSIADVEDGKFYLKYPETIDSFERMTYDRVLKLTSLEGCPKIINGDFDLPNTQLTSLKGGPKIVKGFFNIRNCDITSLEFGPEEVEKSYQVHDTKLTSLEFCPSIIKGSFDCSNTNIRSLDHGPLKVENYCDVAENNILHLMGIGRKYFREIGEELTLPDSIQSHILGLCLIKKLFSLEFIKPDRSRYHNQDDKYLIIEKIMREHLQSDGSECQEELMQNGFNDYAKF